MNFAVKISIVLAITLPLLLLGYSVFSLPASAAQAATQGAGATKSQMSGAESLDAGLIAAVSTGDVNGVQDFLTRGANANAKNPQGLSALAVAAYLGNAQMVNALLRHGARDMDGNALAYAQAGGHTEVVGLLAQAGTGQMGEGKAGLEATVTSVDRPENCLRIRNAPGSSHEIVGCVANGEKLMLTGAVQKGWAQVQSPVQGWVFGRQIRTEGMFPAKAAVEGRRTSESSSGDVEFYEFPEGPESRYYIQPGPRGVIAPRRLLTPGFSAEVGPLRFRAAPAVPSPLP